MNFNVGANSFQKINKALCYMAIPAFRCCQLVLDNGPPFYRVVFTNFCAAGTHRNPLAGNGGLYIGYDVSTQYIITDTKERT